MSDDDRPRRRLHSIPPAESTRRREILALTELIYDAAVEPQLWQSFVESISRSCGNAATAMVFQTGEAGLPSQAYRCEMDPKLSGVANRYLHEDLPWSWRDPRYRQEFVFGSDFFPDPELEATAFYREYMQPQGLEPEAPIATTISVAEGQPNAAMVIYRRVGFRPLDEHDLELCNSLRPHLVCAHKIHCRVHGEREQRKALAEVIDCFPMGVMLLDAKGICLSVNASAERIMSLNDGVALDRERPTVSDDRGNREFHEAIGRAAARAIQEPAGAWRAIAVERPSGGAAFSMMVTPLLAARNGLATGDAAAAVFIADPNEGATSIAALQQLYSLTRAESELVAQLVTGRSLDEIATLRGIQTSTARGYLKNAYKKTGTSGQRELVTLVLTGVAPIKDASAAKTSQRRN